MCFVGWKMTANRARKQSPEWGGVRSCVVLSRASRPGILNEAVENGGLVDADSFSRPHAPPPDLLRNP